jgi:hypothetical protein
MRHSHRAHPKPMGATSDREAGDPSAEVREAVDRDGYSLFKIGLSLSEIPKPG